MIPLGIVLFFNIGNFHHYNFWKTKDVEVKIYEDIIDFFSLHAKKSRWNSGYFKDCIKI